MERFSYRESVLLGYSPKNAFRDRSNSLESPYEDLEIDFDDVFGGPPRRSSAHETRFSFTEPTDNSAFTDDDEEVNSRGSWKGISEKPVFGDEGSHRRRHANDNFFRDIFKGKESYPTSSTSSSRVLSPVRPFSPRAEPSGSPLPAQFSLPARLTKGVELPTFGSTLDGRHKSKDNASDVTKYCSSSPQSGSSSPNQGKKKNDARTSYRQSLLSRETSLSSNVSSNLTKNDETKKSNSSEAPKNGNQFHFSIYKWASNGVPLVMPLRGGNGSRLKENSNSLPGRSSKSNLGKSIVGYRKPTNGPLSTSRQDDEQGEIVDHADVFSPIPGEETKTSSSSEAGLHGKLEGKVSVTTEQAQKPEVKPLCSLFYDYDYEPPAPGSEKIRKKSSGKGGTARSSKKSSVAQDSSKNLKKQDEKRNHLDRAEAGKDGPKGSALNTGDPGKIRTKGKVKDFVKIFNEETLPNPKTGSATRSQSSRRKERHGLKGEKEVNVNRKGTEEKVSVRNGHENRSTTDPSVMGHENLQHKERQQPDMKKAPEPSGSKETVGGRRESLQDFVVKDITPAENDQPQADNNLEETQAIDAKIRKWSNGKEGNIRSLLSTLQYVLWPGSGWKPVPLVNIIDGSAVKKSYQRALLCLHPDKLQQKGASSSQKYIADKVFDILQDAWDHFNSLGSL